ncbi:type III pantothenate kinase [Caproicibacterium sp. NSD3]
MIVAIDVGNTNIVLGCMDAEKIYFTARLSTDASKTADEYALMIRTLFEMHGVERHEPEGGIISSVVPALSAALQEAVRKVCGKVPLLVGSGLKTGLNILMDNPAQLGADLVTEAVAASAEYPKPIIIFDVGTATTMCVVDANGSYIGGMIIPGPVVSLESLAAHASQLSHVSLEVPQRLIGKNTKECMQSGIVFSNAAMIDGIIDRVEAELKEQATIVATGGVAGVIIPFCNRRVILDDNLMLKGLWILYQKNHKD